MTMYRVPSDENTKLTRINFITSLGDFLSFFAMLSRSEFLGSAAIVTGFSIPMKSLASAFGAAVVPYFIARLTSKGAIVFSQFVSLFLSVLILGLVVSDHFSVEFFFIATMLQTLLKQIFEVSRDSHSKSLAASPLHRGQQAQIILGFYGAQFIGPVLAFILLQFTPIWLPLGLDAFSFLIAAYLALTLSAGRQSDKPSNILRPLRSYLWEKNSARSRLRRGIYARTLGFWPGVALFNYLIFEGIAQRFGKDVNYSTWFYAAMGLGGAIAATALKDTFQRLHKRFGNGTLCFFGQMALVIMFLSLELAPSFYVLIFSFVVTGIGMGLNAIGAQTIRRETTSRSEFPEILGLEVVIGRLFFDFGVCALARTAITSGVISALGCIYLAAGLLFINALFVLRLNESQSIQAQ